MFPKTTQSKIRLIASILICEGIGLLGAYFTMPAIPSWYQTLTKPPLTPPGWIFGPVWTILYLLMGISLYLVWDHKKIKTKWKMETITMFAIQLTLNLYWSVLFFGLKDVGAAFVQILILWIAILATIIVFSFISKPAAYLLIPYLAWVTFASYLNWGIWMNLQKKPTVPQVACTQEAKMCPDGSFVGRSGPNCDFDPCPSLKKVIQHVEDLKPTVPTGYTLDTYTIEKVLEKKCTLNTECETPPEYSMMSRCPMMTLCLKSMCTVVCPNHASGQ